MMELEIKLGKQPTPDMDDETIRRNYDIIAQEQLDLAQYCSYEGAT